MIFLTALPTVAAQLHVPVKPIAFVEQLTHCEGISEDGAEASVVDRCVDHAMSILRTGLTRRKSALGDGASAYEAALQIEADRMLGALADLRTKTPDSDARRSGFRTIDESVRSLRRRLAQIAAADRVELSLVSRGGVSLGNWQAGFLFPVTEWAKQQRALEARGGSHVHAAFSTVTGASAGAVNGFAATVEGCKPRNDSASQSVYYQVWIDLGLFGRYGQPGLFPEQEGGSTSLALFTSDALEATLGKAQRLVEEAAMLPGCSVDLGFVATHIDPTSSPVHVEADGKPILTTRKLKEKFSVRVEVPSAEVAPGSGPLRITNIGPTGGYADDQLYYAGLGHGGDVPLETLLTGVRASGAFPGAFPPVVLPYTEYVPGAGSRPDPTHREATFIDGGILDNTPVGLAVALDSWRAQEGRDVEPELVGLIPPTPRKYVFLEPLVRSWERGEEHSVDTREALSQLIDTYLGFTGDLLATTVDAQLADTAEQFEFMRRERRDWTRPRLSVPKRHMPIAGEQFNHFMGFLERDFRIFDFYVGMADAYEYLVHEGCFGEEGGSGCELDPQLASFDEKLQDENPNYRCMRAYYESDLDGGPARITAADLPPECADLQPMSCDVSDPLSRASVEGWLATRSVLHASEPDGCVATAIANHNFRVMLVSMHNMKAWTQSGAYAEEKELDWYFEELSTGEASERFIYVDLSVHLGRDDGYLDLLAVRQAFREIVEESILRIAAAQRGFSKYVIQMGGRTAADVAYGKHLPRHFLGIGMAQSGAEATYGVRLGDSRFRVDTSLRIFKLREESYAPGIEPFTSEQNLAMQLSYIHSPTDFVDIEFGGGWVTSQIAAWNTSRKGHVAFRMGPRATLSAVALKHIYLTANVDYFPVREVDEDYKGTGTRIAEKENWSLVAGWRFLY